MWLLPIVATQHCPQFIDGWHRHHHCRWDQRNQAADSYYTSWSSSWELLRDRARARWIDDATLSWEPVVSHRSVPTSLLHRQKSHRKYFVKVSKHSLSSAPKSYAWQETELRSNSVMFWITLLILKCILFGNISPTSLLVTSWLSLSPTRLQPIAAYASHLHTIMHLHYDVQLLDVYPPGYAQKLLLASTQYAACPL